MCEEPIRWRRRRICWRMTWRSISAAYKRNGCQELFHSTLFSSFALLRHDQPTRRGQEHGRDQALLFELQCGVANDLQMGTGIVHQNQATGIDLREKSANFLLADGHVAVAEEEVDRALDCHVKA